MVAFRFRPPPVTRTPELGWVLAAAFARPESIASSAAAEPALELASRLGLLPRIAVRGAPAPAGTDDPLAPRLRDERARAAALDLRFDATLEEVATAAGEVGADLALLKGRALVASSAAAPGARPSGDLDLLVPPSQLEPLRRALVARGFVAAPDAYEHQAPLLSRAGAADVELHRHLPGVRLAGRRSADWAALADAGRLRPLVGGGHGRELFVPDREVLLAHAVVHALAQHGHHPAYPGWLLVGDLIDLGAIAEEPEAPWRSWIARDVAPREIDAALELARRLAAGDDPLADDPPSDATRLARHFVAAAVDDDYRAALKGRWLDSPVSDRPRWAARLRLAVRAFAPPARAGETPDRRALRWLARPFALAGRGVRALAARRRIRERGD